MANDKVSEKKEDFNEALIMMQNMLEFDKLGRFKFTPKEQSSFLFVIDLLTAHLSELQRL